MARALHRPLLAARAGLLLGALAVTGCLDWQALYEVPCEGAACDHATADAGPDAESACDGERCDGSAGPVPPCKGASCGDAQPPDDGEASLPETCGNGKVEGEEECDDGNAIDTDACLTRCTFARCGDGVVREHVEECDDGSADDEPPCSKQCLTCMDVPGEGWLWEKTGHCYAYDPTPTSFEDASATCADSHNGHLITLGVYAEEAPLYEALGSTDSLTFWLGLRRTGGSFNWLGGGLATRTYWAEGQPGEAPSDCVAETILGSEAAPTSDEEAEERGFMWRAEKCDKKLGYVCERAPPMLRKDDNHAYFPGFHMATWEEARALCEAHGAHLATLGDETEHGFASLTGIVNMWIGAEAFDEPGKYRWITGEAMDYMALAPWDELTDDEEQRCVLLAGDGYWYDKKCSDRAAYLCEVD